MAGKTIGERLGEVEAILEKLRNDMLDAEEAKRCEGYENEFGTHKFDECKKLADVLEYQADMVNEAMHLVRGAKKHGEGCKNV